MSKKEYLNRYLLIIEKVGQNRYPTVKEILMNIELFGEKISQRTLERDLKEIRDIYGVMIKYSREYRGYYIDEEASPNLHEFMRYLEIADTSNLIKDSLADGKATLKHISFDDRSFKGIQLLKPLLKAIKENRKLSFTHFNYKKGKSKVYEIDPYLLKEYHYRWYLVGQVSDSKEMKIFGIDRISDLKTDGSKFKPDLDFFPDLILDEIIGVTLTNKKKESVILSYLPFQGHYVKSLPLHSSQKILIDNEKEFRIELWLAPNYELIQHILMQSHKVKVIEPQWLAEEVKDHLRRSLDQY